MKRSTFLKDAVVVGGGTAIWLPVAPGQSTVQRHEHHHYHHWWTPHVRRRPLPVHAPIPAPPAGGQPAAVEVRSVVASVSIDEQVATTTLTLAFANPGGRQEEGQVLLPVPVGAVLKSFRLEGEAGSFQAELLPREEARRIYDDIVRRSKDPAILEFAGLNAVRSSVFPVPPQGEARVRLTYEELLESDGDRIDYVLPRSESLDYRVPWEIDLDWAVAGGIATVYSPSHPVRQKMERDRVQVSLGGEIDPGAFRVSVLRGGRGGAVASFLAHRERRGAGGWFLMLMALPERPAGERKLSREVTLVIDRSGSMAGEKLDQARAAALQVAEGLAPDDRFNLIVYNEAVEEFSPSPLPATRENVVRARGFINGIRVSGGTNIHDALAAAVGQPARKGSVPIVLFLTDGLPTIGETSEKRIRNAIDGANRARRRIFTFGVGVDVNTPLLSRLADDSRATATYVLPDENVEVKVAQVFRRLAGPVLSEPELAVVDGEGSHIPGAVTDLLPARLPDFFARDQVVLAGRFRDARRLKFRLAGHDGERRREYEFGFNPRRGRHAFVPRLWATRKIAVLTEALRDLGADASMAALTGDQVDRNDPRVKELVDEIVRLSTEHGVLTEYTAFLARDGAVFDAQASRQAEATDNFQVRALLKRSGADAVNQELNLWSQKNAQCLNPFNRYVDSELKGSTVANVQQLADKAFYRRGDAWVDAALAAEEAGASPAVPPAEQVEIGSPEFGRLVDVLVANGQQGCLTLGANLDVVVEGKRYRLE